ncbi:hypothetical protein C900_00602 [Fulvivirga imtechensis AK7]|uniref:Uncharacterized protein n=1 Tax=Fulvivirga imtechensis AK7 TaxID=1237149 RepID=L8JJ49_9BACT|nr:hypothetical protein C900_00602 [Fulvivirga imtechensis AK7]
MELRRGFIRRHKKEVTDLQDLLWNTFKNLTGITKEGNAYPL